MSKVKFAVEPGGMPRLLSKMTIGEVLDARDRGAKFYEIEMPDLEMPIVPLPPPVFKADDMERRDWFAMSSRYGIPAIYRPQVLPGMFDDGLDADERAARAVRAATLLRAVDLLIAIAQIATAAATSQLLELDIEFRPQAVAEDLAPDPFPLELD